MSPGLLVFELSKSVRDPGEVIRDTARHGGVTTCPHLSSDCVNPALFLCEELEAGLHITGQAAADTHRIAAGHPTSPHRRHFCGRAGS